MAIIRAAEAKELARRNLADKEEREDKERLTAEKLKLAEEHNRHLKWLSDKRKDIEWCLDWAIKLGKNHLEYDLISGKTSPKQCFGSEAVILERWEYAPELCNFLQWLRDSGYLVVVESKSSEHYSYSENGWDDKPYYRYGDVLKVSW